MKKLTGIAATLLMVLFCGRINAQLTANAGGDTATICPGGYITIGGNPTASGGTPPYSYAWSPAAGLSCTNCANPIASPTVATTYTVTVSDNSIFGDTAIDSVTIAFGSGTGYTSLAISSLVNPSSCNGNDGAIWISGLCDFCLPDVVIYYRNSVLQGPFSIEGFPTAGISGLTTGSYTNIIVMRRGCPSNILAGPYVLTHPSSPVIDSFTVNNVSCFGGNDGSSCIHVSGGTPPYNYAWNDAQMAQCAVGRPAGNYILTVTDASGCSIFGLVTITEPATPLSISETHTDVSCGGTATGSIDLTVSGGTPGYTFLWSHGETIEDPINLPAGVYNVTVTDVNGCTAGATITITEPPALNVSITTTGDGIFPDTLDVNVTGGCPPYLYQWDDGSITTQSIVVVYGTYTVTITDNCACSTVDSIIISGPTGLTADAGADQSICPGDTAVLGGNPTAIGGTSPYTYAWSPASGISCFNCPNPVAYPVTTTTYMVTVTDNIGITATDAVTIFVRSVTPLVIDSFINPSTCGGSDGAILVGGLCDFCLASSVSYDKDGIPQGPFILASPGGGYVPINGATTAGTYTNIVITDGPSGCILPPFGPFILSDAPSPVIDSITTSNGSCTGGLGSACVYASGGVSPYIYSWGNGGSAQCESSLNSGIYPVTVADQNGCSVTANVYINIAPLLQLTAIPTNISCFGANDGSIDVTAFGGEVPYTFQWSDTVFTLDRSGLSAGTYSVTVWDSYACTASDTVTITEPPQLQTSVSTTDATCGQCDGQAGATVTGGTSLYSYEYIQLPVLPRCTALQCDLLCAGNQYLFKVTDSNGCVDSVLFTIGQASSLQVDSATSTNVSCNGGNNGSACVYLSGGVQPYLYYWSNNETSQCINGLTAGNYTVTVVDASQCSVAATVTITEPTPIQVDSVTYTNISCNGVVDGSACVYPLGGVQPYHYFWSNNDTTQCITGLVAGNYTVIVADASLCTGTATVTITEPRQLQIDSITTTNGSCFGGTGGSACVYASGGALPYNYFWSSNDTTQCGTSLAAGTHSIIVTDNNGCTVDTSLNITEPPQLTAQIISATGGLLPDTLTAIGNGGTPYSCCTGYTYIWNFGDTSQTLKPWCAEMVMVWVTDSIGCFATDSILIQDSCIAGCVWPGDADNNGVADNYDLLPIGLAYGSSEIPRCNVSLIWKGQYARDWSDTLTSGTNYKHIDCDGNGTINADDTLAIIQNFGLTHAKTNERKAWKLTAPALLVDLVPDTTHAGDTMYANLSLGEMNIPANNVYGLAFTFNYNTTVVDTSKTTITFGNSWLGTSVDKISIAKDLKLNGQLKCAITRIDHATRSGFGQIGQATFVITTDNINGKNTLAYYAMEVWISDLVMIDNLGNIIPVNEGSDSAQVEFEPTGIGELQITNYELRINPNPAAGDVQLVVSENLVGGEMKLLDVTGRVLFRTLISTHTSHFTTHNFVNGIYIVQVVTEKGMLTKRLVIAR